MAVENPDIAQLMEKAEKNSQYFLSLMCLGHPNSSKKRKRRRMALCVRSLCIRMDLLSMMDSLMTIMNQRIKSSWLS
jgi:hypothetical protein